MKLENGQVITLDNGDIVKVSLEVIGKKISKLEAGKSYKLKREGNFCHAKNTVGKDFGNIVDKFTWQFLGEVDCYKGSTEEENKRYIFFSNDEGSVYSMWSTRNLDFVVNEVV